LAQICTKLFSGWSFAPDPAGGAHSAPPNPLAGKWEGKGVGGKGNRKGGKGSEGRLPPLKFKSGFGLRVMFVNVRGAGLC